MSIGHTKAMYTPRMGGLGIYIAFVCPMLMLYYFDDTQKGIMLGSGIALLIGILDDVWGVKATIKLISIFLLTLLLKKYGVTSNLPFQKFGVNSDIANTVVSLVWIAGITSAINALDHMDGLAGGVSLVACLSYFAVSLQTYNFFWGLISISLAGAMLGFLFFNKNPAKIFMGDSGSFFIGFTLAATGLMGGWSSNPIKASIIPVLILSLPIFDLAFVIISRHLNGTTKTLREAITYCGKDHIGHRMIKLGFSQKSAAWIICIFSLAVSISAITVRNLSGCEALLILFQIVLMYLVVLLMMKRLH